MKVDAKSKSDYDAQQFKFKSREFQIESVIEVEIPALANSSAAEAFSEWKEFSFEEKSTDQVRFVLFARCLFVINGFDVVYISHLK